MTDSPAVQRLNQPIIERLRPHPGSTPLSPDSVPFDCWFADANVHHSGCVRFCVDGPWLYGCAEVDRVDDMQVAAHRAYAGLFQVLGESASPHLIRLWNYFPHINEKNGGVERYRQFNAGRQQAFIEARYSAFKDSPAACALGTQSGPLLVYFLAGERPPTAIENPRQVSAYRYPAIYGISSPTFSRAALVNIDARHALLVISGTASIVGHSTVHIGDVRRQTEESLANLAAVRTVASERAGTAFSADAMTYTVYVRRPADLAVVRSVFAEAVGAGSRAAIDAIFLQADICRSDLLVEIEAMGIAQVPTAA